MSRFGQRVRPSNSIATSAVANWFGNQFVTFNPWMPQPSIEGLGTFTLAASATSVTLSLPTGYKDIKLIWSARSTTAGSAQDEVQLRFNADSTSSYSYHFLYGNGSSPVSSAGTSQTYIRSGFVPRASATASIFGATILDLVDYSSTTKNKTIRSFSGADLNDANGLIAECSGTWYSLNPVTSVTLQPESGNSFPSGSQFEIYGVR